MEVKPGQAIFCECKFNNALRILGSITAEGFMEIKRAHNCSTMIQVPELLLKCGQCGNILKIRIESVPNYRATDYEKQN